MWKPNKKQINIVKNQYLIWTKYPTNAPQDELNNWIKNTTKNKSQLINKDGIPEKILVATWKQGMSDCNSQNYEESFENWWKVYLDNYNNEHRFKDNKEYVDITK